MSNINEIFKFEQRSHKAFRVFMTTHFLRIMIKRRVGNNVFGVEEVISLKRLTTSLGWRTIVADVLRKLRHDLRIEVAKRYPYRIVAPNYHQATQFAWKALRLPNSCWIYVNALDYLIGLERGTTIHVVNGGPESAAFRYAFWSYIRHRNFKIIHVKV